MAIDREDTLKKAEKLLRQGKLDVAIAEYLRDGRGPAARLEHARTRWATSTSAPRSPTRRSRSTCRSPITSSTRGSIPRRPRSTRRSSRSSRTTKQSQLHLGEISAKQGLLADAKAYLTAVAARRRARDDTRGADEIVVRLGSLDPADFDARAGGRTPWRRPATQSRAAMRFRAHAHDLLEKGRAPEAMQALREAVRCNPDDREGRAILARAAVAAGDLDGARGYLDRATAGRGSGAADGAHGDRAALRRDRTGPRDSAAAARASTGRCATRSSSSPGRSSESNPAAAFVCIDTAVDASTSALAIPRTPRRSCRSSSRACPGTSPALLKLVEICVDGGLEATMYEAQAQLADAYLAGGQAAEARVIAEDLVAREPWEPRTSNGSAARSSCWACPSPTRVIAERLSGQTPFMAKDHFSDPVPDAPPPAPPPAPARARTGACRRGREGEGAGLPRRRESPSPAARSRSI